MSNLDALLDKNRSWATRITQSDPTFFQRLARQQSPDYLWIGCSDSRVPATQLVDLAPGEMFVQRNVANVVAHNDINCLSVVQYAVDVLQVKHIIVCGHYGCGGVQAALHNKKLGLVDNWLQGVRAVVEKHGEALEAIAESERADRLCELNVIEQARNVSQTEIVQRAWARDQNLSIHALIYGINDGLLRPLDFNVRRSDEVPAVYERSVNRILDRGAAEHLVQAAE